MSNSYSSSRDTDEHEDLDDTAAGPSTTNDPNNTSAPSSTWYSSGALVLIFDPFGHSMTKGEYFELVFKRVCLYGHFFAKLQLSFFWNFIGSSCKLKPDGALIFLMCFSACLFLIYVNARMLNYINHHISSCISNSSLWYVKCVYELQDIGGDLHDSTLQVCNASKASSSPCRSSGGVLLYLAIKFLNISIYTSYVYHCWKLNLFVINHQKGGDCKCI